MSAQNLTPLPEIRTVPIPEKTTSRYKTSRRQKTCPCGVCGNDIAVNRDGTYRVHGPEGDRCPGTGVSVKASVLTGRNGAYGTCGLCGIVRENREQVRDAKAFVKAHNHLRPKVTPEGGRTAVLWFRYRTYEWRRRVFGTHEKAMNFASNIKEHTR